jgi:hypothetical protein
MKASKISQKVSAADALTAHIAKVQMQTNTAKKPTPPQKQTPTSNHPPTTYDERLIRVAIRAGIEDPRFSAVSTHSKSVLTYLASTTPKFSASALVRKYVDAGLAREFPDIWSKTSEEDTL